MVGLDFVIATGIPQRQRDESLVSLRSRELSSAAMNNAERVAFWSDLP
jgi:hypothetical protein